MTHTLTCNLFSQSESLNSPCWWPRSSLAALHQTRDQILAEHLQDRRHLRRPAPGVHLPANGGVRVSVRGEESLVVGDRSPCTRSALARWKIWVEGSNKTKATLTGSKYEISFIATPPPAPQPSQSPLTLVTVVYRSWAHAGLSSGPLVVSSESGSLRGRTQITLILFFLVYSVHGLNVQLFLLRAAPKPSATRRQVASPATWNTGLFHLRVLPSTFDQ